MSSPAFLPWQEEESFLSLAAPFKGKAVKTRLLSRRWLHKNSSTKHVKKRQWHTKTHKNTGTQTFAWAHKHKHKLWTNPQTCKPLQSCFTVQTCNPKQGLKKKQQKTENNIHIFFYHGIGVELCVRSVGEGLFTGQVVKSGFVPPIHHHTYNTPFLFYNAQ